MKMDLSPGLRGSPRHTDSAWGRHPPPPPSQVGPEARDMACSRGGEKSGGTERITGDPTKTRWGGSRASDDGSGTLPRIPARADSVCGPTFFGVARPNPQQTARFSDGERCGAGGGLLVAIPVCNSSAAPCGAGVWINPGGTPWLEGVLSPEQLPARATTMVGTEQSAKKRKGPEKIFNARG